MKCKRGLQLLGYVVAHIAAVSQETYAAVTGTGEVTKRSFEAATDEALRLLSQKALPLVSDLVGSPELSIACSSSLIKLFLHLRLKEPWALRMVTANGFIPTNLFEGSLVNLGGYEQCLKTRFGDPNAGGTAFKGRYCTLFTRPPRDAIRSLVERFQAAGLLQGRQNPLTVTTDTRFQSIDFRMGICMPSLCSPSDLNFVIGSMQSCSNMELMRRFKAAERMIPSLSLCSRYAQSHFSAL